MTKEEFKQFAASLAPILSPQAKEGAHKFAHELAEHDKRSASLFMKHVEALETFAEHTVKLGR